MIFVDDASTDGSTEILRNLQQADERVVFIELPRNVGQLKAMEIGLRHAAEDIIVFTSSDTQNPISNIAVLCKAVMSGHDLAIGYRAVTTERDISSYLSRGFYGVLRFFILGMPSGGFDMGAIDRSMAEKLCRLDFAKIAMEGTNHNTSCLRNFSSDCTLPFRLNSRPVVNSIIGLSIANETTIGYPVPVSKNL